MLIMEISRRTDWQKNIKSIHNLLFPEKITSNTLLYIFLNPSYAFICILFFLENGIWVHIKFYKDYNQGQSNRLNFEEK